LVPFLASVAEVLSEVGSRQVNVLVVPVAAVVLVIARRWQWAAFLIVVSQGGLLLANASKRLVARERPPWNDFDPTELGTSFPSGHTFTGITIWVALGLVLLFVLPRPWATVVAAIPIAIGVLNGPSRLVSAQHWISDVVGAWLLAIGWLLVVAGVFLWATAEERKPSQR
jgi:undecaprenyl-diphosphatase